MDNDGDGLTGSRRT